MNKPEPSFLETLERHVVITSEGTKKESQKDELGNEFGVDKIKPLITPYLIYTDGGCAFSKTKNHKLNSWAFVVIDPLTQKIVAERHEALDVSEKSLANNMELLAVEKALEFLPPNSVAILYSDSQNALDWTRKAVCQLPGQVSDPAFDVHYQNIKKILQDDEKKHIHIKKVRAHRNNYWNNYVDYLCDKAIAEKVIGSLKDLFNGQSTENKFVDYGCQPELNLPQIEKLNELKNLKLEGKPYKIPIYDVGYNKEKLKEKGIELAHYGGFEREELVHFALEHGVKLKESQKGQITVSLNCSFDYQIDHQDQHIYHKSIGKIKYICPQKAVLLALAPKLDLDTLSAIEIRIDALPKNENVITNTVLTKHKV